MRLRAITDRTELETIIQKCQYCHLAMVDPAGMPYVIPMNFGYRDGIIYLHGSQHGKKIEILSKNPEVCINFTTDTMLRYQSEQVACSWAMNYRSVLCYGTVEFVTGLEEKVRCLDIIMSQYSPREFKYNPPALREVNVFTVKVTRFEGRAFGL